MNNPSSSAVVGVIRFVWRDTDFSVALPRMIVNSFHVTTKRAFRDNLKYVQMRLRSHKNRKLTVLNQLSLLLYDWCLYISRKSGSVKRTTSFVCKPEVRLDKSKGTVYPSQLASETRLTPQTLRTWHQPIYPRVIIRTSRKSGPKEGS